MPVLLGDCRKVLAGLEAESVDAVVTDPPYELAFMGKSWDQSGVAFQPETWAAVLRVMKPGAHLLAFGGTRTYHRTVCAIEDAGFEVRDCLMWIYGSGFPKSLDVSKAIDKAAGAERDVIGEKLSPDGVPYSARKKTFQTAGSHDGYKRPSDSCPRTELTAPATDAARRWQGWGTALKPAYEPIVLARKPLAGTVAANVQQYGTGAINVDGCRVAGVPPSVPQPKFNSPTGAVYGFKAGEGRNGEMSQATGRWPANVIHDGSDEVVGLFPQTTGMSSGGGNHFNGQPNMANPQRETYSDSGSAARFFYCAKASRRERGEGNTHPTVKPVALMRYLVRLITPPNGLVLDPFAGSGSTGIAALLEGFRFLGIEQQPEYVALAERRIQEWTSLPIEREA